MSDLPPTTVTVNVGTLSNALALAIQQATSSGRDTIATPSASNVPGPSHSSGAPNPGRGSGNATAGWLERVRWRECQR